MNNMLTNLIKRLEQENNSIVLQSGIDNWKPFTKPEKFMKMVKPLLNKKQYQTVEFLVNNEYTDEKGEWYWIQPTGLGKMEEFIHLFMYSIVYYRFEKPDHFYGIYNSHRICLTFANCQRILKRITAKDEKTPILSTLKDYFDLLNSHKEELTDDDVEIIKKMRDDWYSKDTGTGLCIPPEEVGVINVNSGDYTTLNKNEYDVFGYKSILKEDEGIIDYINKTNKKYLLFICCYQSSKPFLEIVEKNYSSIEPIFDIMMNDEFHSTFDLENEDFEAWCKLKIYCKRVYNTSATDLEIIPQIKQKGESQFTEEDLKDEDRKEYEFWKTHKNSFGKRVESLCCGKEEAMINGYITPIKVYNWTLKSNHKPIIWRTLADPKTDQFVKRERANFLINYLYNAFIASKQEFDEKDMKVQLFGLLPMNHYLLEQIRTDQSAYKMLCNQNEIWTYMIDSINGCWVIPPNQEPIEIKNENDFLLILNNKKEAFENNNQQYKDLCCDPNHHNFILNMNKLNVGIDLPNINTVVIARIPDMIILDQGIGRGLRLLPIDRKMGYMDQPEFSAIRRPDLYKKAYCIVHFNTNMLLDEDGNNGNAKKYYNEVILPLCNTNKVTGWKWFEVKESNENEVGGDKQHYHFRNINSEEVSLDNEFEKNVIKYFDNIQLSYNELKESIESHLSDFREQRIFCEERTDNLINQFIKYYKNYHVIIQSNDSEITQRDKLNDLLTQMEQYIQDNN